MKKLLVLVLSICLIATVFAADTSDAAATSGPSIQTKTSTSGTATQKTTKKSKKTKKTKKSKKNNKKTKKNKKNIQKIKKSEKSKMAAVVTAKPMTPPSTGISPNVVTFAPTQGIAGDIGVKSTYHGASASFPNYEVMPHMTASYGFGDGLAVALNGQASWKGAFEKTDNPYAPVGSEVRTLGYNNYSQEPFAVRGKYGLSFQYTMASLQMGLDVNMINNIAYNSLTSSYEDPAVNFGMTPIKESYNGIVNGYEVKPYLQMRLDSHNVIYLEGFSRTIAKNKSSFSATDHDNLFETMSDSHKGQMWGMDAQYNYKLANNMLLGSYVRVQIANDRYTELQRMTNAPGDDLGDQIDIKPMIVTYQMEETSLGKTIFSLYPELEINNFRKSDVVYLTGERYNTYNAKLALVPQVEQDIMFGNIDLFAIGQVKMENSYVTAKDDPNAPNKNLNFQAKATLGVDYNF